MQALVSGESDHVEGLSWDRDGRPVPVELHVSRIEHSGAPFQPEQLVACASNAREAVGEHGEVVDEFVRPRAVVYI